MELQASCCWDSSARGGQWHPETSLERGEEDTGYVSREQHRRAEQRRRGTGTVKKKPEMDWRIR